VKKYKFSAFWERLKQLFQMLISEAKIFGISTSAFSLTIFLLRKTYPKEYLIV